MKKCKIKDQRSIPPLQDLYSDTRKVQLIWPPFLPSDYSSQFLRDHTKVKPTAAIECPVTQKVR